jgi:hypothetical protein
MQISRRMAQTGEAKISAIAAAFKRGHSEGKISLIIFCRKVAVKNCPDKDKKAANKKMYQYAKPALFR